jgi:hypothetical protein
VPHRSGAATTEGGVEDWGRAKREASGARAHKEREASWRRLVTSRGGDWRGRQQWRRPTMEAPRVKVRVEKDGRHGDEAQFHPIGQYRVFTPLYWERSLLVVVQYKGVGVTVPHKR